MTIYEALKSGKRIKHPDLMECIDVSDPYSKITINAHSLMRTDWTVEEPEVTVTKSQLKKAWDEHVGSSAYFDSALDNLCKELGLE